MNVRISNRSAGVAIAVIVATIGFGLVLTGKFRSESVARADREPDHVIDSFADLATLLSLD